MTDETKKEDLEKEEPASADDAKAATPEAEKIEETKPLGSTSTAIESPAESISKDAELAATATTEPADESKLPQKTEESSPSKKSPDEKPKDTNASKDGDGPTFEGLMSLMDLESKPTSRAGWAIRAAVTIVGIALLWRNVDHLTKPMLSAKPPVAIPTEELAGDKFRLSEPERKEIFKEFATAELAERQRAITQNTWQGHAWSREDDRGYIERTTARTTAARHHCSLSQVYLVLDEGIREHWLAPDGKPLPATTPPFNPRTTW